MIPPECKRLAEVDFPIAVVSRHSAREKSIRHGHPSTLHLWWARRPLAACRAMLMALLLPDPSDPNCPEDFKQRARNILPRVQGSAGPKDAELRSELLRFIGEFANWDNSMNETYLEAARGLVRAAHGGEIPLVVDPFAGGGSIPLEALRAGCDVFASELNPVACLILKTMLEDIPRRGPSFGEELRKLGAEIMTTAHAEIEQLYPPEADGSNPIVYLWARTITCDNCGAEIPLIRSFWLSKRSTRRLALRYEVQRLPKQLPRLSFTLVTPNNDSDVQKGTIVKGRVSCPCCPTVIPPERVRSQLSTQRYGTDARFDQNGQRAGGALLLAVITRKKTGETRFRLPTVDDLRFVRDARELREKAFANDLIPNELVNPIRPSPNARGLSAVTRCGVSTFADLFNVRQQLALVIVSTHIAKVKDPELKRALGCVLGRCVDYWSSGAVWAQSGEFVAHTFGRQALPVISDFAEVAPFSNASGSFQSAIDWVAGVIRTCAVGKLGQVEQADACFSPLSDTACNIWFTDPPYYDAIPYADLSDYFYVWLRRAIPEIQLVGRVKPDITGLTPKVEECVWNNSYEVNGRRKDGSFFERCAGTAFAEGRRVLDEGGVGCVVFAHKTTEGWEALLSGIIAGKWIISASWPVATERSGRLQSRDAASLATSVHLVCRPRQADAGIGDWGDVLRELPQRVGDWIERLQSEGVKGADLVFACIGPAMGIYSRYRRVEDAEGREIPLGGDPTAIEPYQRGFLAYVWETVGRLALEEVLGTAEAKARNGAASALEEDSRLTALFLWTLQSTQTENDASSASAEEEHEEESGEREDEDEPKSKKKKKGYTLIYDVARRFAQPLGIHLEKWEGRIIETDKGVVRLLPIAERAPKLFGEEDAAAISQRFEDDVRANRNLSFSFMQEDGAAPQIKSRGRGKRSGKRSVAEAPASQPITTLDRLHAAMLLQRSGQTNGLRALLKEEIQRGPDFVRLANALSRLYPKESDEKRLLDAMLLAVPKN